MHEDTAAYGLDEMIRDMTAMVDRYGRDADRVREAEPLVGRLICSDGWLPAEKRVPSSQSYARHSLYRDPQDRFEILALVWLPEQRTPIHDHDGTWGVEGVLAGRMKVTNFEQVRAVPGVGTELRHMGVVMVNEGGTGQLLPPADCHVLETQGDGATITIHVYGKQLQQFRLFDPTATEGLYRVRMNQVGYSA